MLGATCEGRCVPKSFAKVVENSKREWKALGFLLALQKAKSAALRLSVISVSLICRIHDEEEDEDSRRTSYSNFTF